MRALLPPSLGPSLVQPKKKGGWAWTPTPTVAAPTSVGLIASIQVLLARRPAVSLYGLEPTIDWMDAARDALMPPSANAANLSHKELVAIGLVVDALSDTADTLRDSTIEIVNRSSVVLEDPQDATVLEELPLDAWRTAVHALGELARQGQLANSDLGAAVARCQDAALTVLQARAVLSARDTWRAGAAVTPSYDTAIKGDQGGELGDIFADSGFSNGVEAYEDTARNRKGVRDWCGMFVSAAMFRGAAMDREIRIGLVHTDNVRDYFTYGSRETMLSSHKRTPKSIWAEGAWHPLREYHERRGALRTWAQPPTTDIRPGDVVLIDNEANGRGAGGAIADHVCMVESYDKQAQILRTIEGNIKSGIRPRPDGSIDRLPTGEIKQPATLTNSTTGVHIRDLTSKSIHSATKATNGGYAPHGGGTVFGVGRPSFVDFEDHEYFDEPVPKEYAKMSPDAMRQQLNPDLRKDRRRVGVLDRGPQARSDGPYATRAAQQRSARRPRL